MDAKHTILCPSGTKYSSQDPAQLDEISTQNRGGMA